MGVSTSYYNYSTSFFTTEDSESSSSGSSNILGDYYSIQNGSYKKLLKAYYAKQEAEESGTDSSTNEATKKEYISIKQDADALYAAANDLQNYDSDSIASQVKSYVDAYNSMLDSAAETDNTQILRKAAWMTTTTSSYKNLLSDIGISIGSDNKLELDETKLKEADASVLKTLFQGSNSYMSKMASKAEDISSEALLSINSEKTYGANGKYSTGSTSGISYDSTI